jgi:hypothetical protein
MTSIQLKDLPRLSDPLTKLSLICGEIAGPFFTIAWFLEGATRPGYDPLLHPISSLAIGEFGWTQIASFIVTGILTLALTLGLRRLLTIPGGSTWGPILIGMVAVGFLGAGFFITDPMNGYPPGTPALPLQYSLAGRLHRLFSALVFLGLPIACFVIARMFNRWGERRWGTYSVVTGILFIVLFVITSAGFGGVPGLVDYAGLSQRVTLTTGWLWLTLFPIHLLRFPGKEQQSRKML